MRGLGQLEAEVMDRLWTVRGPTTVREMVTWLQAERAIAYTTVMTVMDNLHRKGMLSRQPTGRAYQYLPTCTREEYSARLMREALADSRDPAGALLQFVAELSPAQVRNLRAALERKRPRRPS